MTGASARDCVKPIHGAPASTKALAWQWQENNLHCPQQIHICMILKSFGCSFTFGSDLADAGHVIGQHSRHTWPSLLAQHLGMEYQCHAFPGIGNLRIAEAVLQQVGLDTTPNMYVINWTYIDRFDYDREGRFSGRWKTIRPTDTSDQAAYYYRHFHSQYLDKLTDLITIKTVMDAVAAGGHRMIVTCLDDLLFETRYHYNSAIKLLQSHIQSHVVTFENKNFLEWSQQNKFAISDPGCHPLETAHQAAFELIKNYNQL
jgi:hypothetical protein